MLTWISVKTKLMKRICISKLLIDFVTFLTVTGKIKENEVL